MLKEEEERGERAREGGWVWSPLKEERERGERDSKLCLFVWGESKWGRKGGSKRNWRVWVTEWVISWRKNINYYYYQKIIINLFYSFINVCSIWRFKFTV